MKTITGTKHRELQSRIMENINTMDNLFIMQKCDPKDPIVSPSSMNLNDLDLHITAYVDEWAKMTIAREAFTLRSNIKTRYTMTSCDSHMEDMEERISKEIDNARHNEDTVRYFVRALLVEKFEKEWGKKSDMYPDSVRESSLDELYNYIWDTKGKYNYTASQKLFCTPDELCIVLRKHVYDWAYVKLLCRLYAVVLRDYEWSHIMYYMRDTKDVFKKELKHQLNNPIESHGLKTFFMETRMRVFCNEWEILDPTTYNIRNMFTMYWKDSNPSDLWKNIP